MSKVKAQDQAIKMAKQNGEVAYVILDSSGYGAVLSSKYFGLDNNIVLEVDAFGNLYDHRLPEPNE